MLELDLDRTNTSRWVGRRGQPRGMGALALIIHKVNTDVKCIVILFGTMIHLGTKNKNLFSLHPLAYYTEKIVLLIFRFAVA